MTKLKDLLKQKLLAETKTDRRRSVMTPRKTLLESEGTGSSAKGQTGEEATTQVKPAPKMTKELEEMRGSHTWARPIFAMLASFFGMSAPLWVFKQLGFLHWLFDKFQALQDAGHSQPIACVIMWAGMSSFCFWFLGGLMILPAI